MLSFKQRAMIIFVSFIADIEREILTFSRQTVELDVLNFESISYLEVEFDEKLRSSDLSTIQLL